MVLFLKPNLCAAIPNLAKLPAAGRGTGSPSTRLRHPFLLPVISIHVFNMSRTIAQSAKDDNAPALNCKQIRSEQVTTGKETDYGNMNGTPL